MEEDDENKTPRVKRQYRSWMKNPFPQSPRTTEQRFLQNKRLFDDTTSSNLDENEKRRTCTISNAISNPSALAISPVLLSEEKFDELLENDTMDSSPIIDMLPESDNLTSEDELLDSSDEEHKEKTGENTDMMYDNDSLDNLPSMPNAENNFTNTGDNWTDAEDTLPSDADRTDGNKGPTKIPKLEAPLLPNLSTTVFETLLMVINFAFRHGLTSVAIEDLCKMINCILEGELIPTSKYLLNKIFNDSNSDYTFHFYCAECEAYIGEKQLYHKDAILTCSICGKECNVKKNNDGYYFVTLSVGKQITSLLESTENILDLLKYRMNLNTNEKNICDIFDGYIYKKLAREGNILSNPNNLSVTFNTDGASVFDSSKSTLWPIHFRINELPPTLRFNPSNSMICGIWFGKKEPNMTVFLTPFVKEAQILYEAGINWRVPTDGSLIKSKVVILNCVVDSKAKPIVQNIKQFNGYYGCGYCYHPGVVLDEGSNQVKYRIDSEVQLSDDCSCTYSVNVIDRFTNEEAVHKVEDRYDKKMRAEMKLAETERLDVGGRVVVKKGVKGVSALCFLPPVFDIVNGFCVDYMHAVLLGVTRLVTGLWFDSTSHGRAYYIGKDVGVVSERLLKITPPTSISRRPRPLSERNDWKANEWRCWLLLYSLPCLINILPSAYLRHHCILVTAIQIYLQDSITPEELKTAARYLIQYTMEFQRLYGNTFMHYNVHLLLHVAKCVSLWGPLWCYSTFSFENSNGCLVRLVKGTRGVAHQIAYKYSICKYIPKLLKIYHVKENVIEFCNDLTCYRIAALSSKCNNNVTLLGAEKKIILSEEELGLLENFVLGSYAYERMIKDNILYHARCYSRRGERSDNSVIKLVSGSYGVIEKILKLNRDVFIIVRDINIDRFKNITSHRCGANVPHIKVSSEIVYGSLRLVHAREIVKKVILMFYGEFVYIGEFPNVYEKD